MADIFVIDDDEQLLQMVGLMLERAGHQPTLISDPAEGLERIMETVPDAVILDVMMPHLNGHDICRAIRAEQKTAHIPIMVLTARAQPIDREAALKSGADVYLSKPVDGQELVERLDGLLNHHPDGGTDRAGMMISFMGLRGGIGRTTLAVNLAGALRRISQEEVCLVELTPAAGQAAAHLRLQPKSSWADLPAANELDWESLKKHLTIHPSGLRLLAGPQLPHLSADLTGELTAAILRVLAEKMTAVVLDLPPVVNQPFQTALSASDMILHIVTPEVIAIQVALQTNRALAESGLKMKKPIHILNHVSSDTHLTAEAVEQGLNAKLAFQISYDANQQRALAQGVPLTLTSTQSPLSVAVMRMAEVIWQRVRQNG